MNKSPDRSLAPPDGVRLLYEQVSYRTRCRHGYASQQSPLARAKLTEFVLFRGLRQCLAAFTLLAQLPLDHTQIAGNNEKAADSNKDHHQQKPKLNPGHELISSAVSAASSYRLPVR